MNAGWQDKHGPERASEIELKLELAADAAGKLLRHPLMSQARALPDQGGALHAVYYDSTDCALHKAGLTLRVRQRNGRSTQTIKAERKTRGLALDRGEWEIPVEDGPDLAAAAGTPLAPLVAREAVRHDLKPVFTVDTDRRAFEIERDGATIELALDEARASTGAGAEHFCEVELELKKGNPSALFALAEDLAGSIPFRLSPVTKSERGYRLLGQADVTPVKAGRIVLPTQASCAEAFQVIARACLSQIIRNEALLRRSDDPELVHQMRVGFRRLNAAVSLFEPMLRDRDSKAVRAEIRWAGKKLGLVRDLDVLIARLRKADDPDKGPQVLEEAERLRAEAFEKVLKILSKPRFMRAVLKAATWVESGRWLARRKPSIVAARDLPARALAAEEFSRRWQRIRQGARRMDDLDGEDRHKLRIRIKKLRYGVEFFATLFPGIPARKSRKAMLDLLEGLQDMLGKLNDIEVGKTLLDPPFRKWVRKAAGDTKRRERKLLSQAGKASRKLAKAEPFWASTP
ncbi:CYTH and CHAD domain-containing protein [Microvirga mediterraneensis]|uniref:CHAD domain-containing protein n=1 Tax=Microvirga mediterraneensis TaxID=2754695 RepID=A0A838BTA7_9HYPH|nr:CYTH and CHAD domain-containing protein [Microvirga mediterraneensis]MBA1158608.1 CHAD domain-containing protein [Microvirga mediterraneensis]